MCSFRASYNLAVYLGRSIRAWWQRDAWVSCHFWCLRKTLIKVPIKSVLGVEPSPSNNLQSFIIVALKVVSMPRLEMNVLRFAFTSFYTSPCDDNTLSRNVMYFATCSLVAVFVLFSVYSLHAFWQKSELNRKDRLSSNLEAMFSLFISGILIKFD